MSESQIKDWQYSYPPLSEGIELEVCRTGFNGTRFVKCSDGQFFFTDCRHPEQNTYCTNESIEAWRVKT